MTEAIITLALVGIGQHSVGFGGFFEFVFRLRIALVLIGMMLMSETAIGALQILFGHTSINSQNFVIIAFVYRHKDFFSN